LQCVGLFKCNSGRGSQVSFGVVVSCMFSVSKTERASRADFLRQWQNRPLPLRTRHLRPRGPGPAPPPDAPAGPTELHRCLRQRPRPAVDPHPASAADRRTGSYAAMVSLACTRRCLRHYFSYRTVCAVFESTPLQPWFTSCVIQYSEMRR